MRNIIRQYKVAATDIRERSRIHIFAIGRVSIYDTAITNAAAVLYGIMSAASSLHLYCIILCVTICQGSSHATINAEYRHTMQNIPYLYVVSITISCATI